MNSRKQAAKGFKTFLITLITSLVIFSGIYYVINSQEEDTTYYESSQTQDYEDVLGSDIEEPKNKESETPTNVKGASNMVPTENTEESEESVFADLANQKMDDNSTESPVSPASNNEQVLAESDSVDTTSTVDTEPTADTTLTTDTTDTTAVAESTVPDTGVSGPTMGLVMTIIIMGFAGYIMFLGPRNVALHNFEKDTIEDLD